MYPSAKSSLRINSHISLLLMLAAIAVPASAEQAPSQNAIAKRVNSLPAINNSLPPLITEKYQYHEVCGCSEKDLQCDLTQKAIRCNDGNKYDSITKWKVTWDYGYIRSGGTCSIDSFRLTVDITIHLPQWMSAHEAPQVLVDKWNGYIKNLMLHEHGHRDRVLSAASELTRTMAELPPSRFCWQLDEQVGTLCQKRLQKLIKEQDEYDAVTGHGHIQGVVFPYPGFHSKKQADLQPAF